MAPPFGVRFGDDVGRAQFHFVTRGPVYLRCASGEQCVLQTGDAVLLPRGVGHEMLSSPDITATTLKVLLLPRFVIVLMQLRPVTRHNVITMPCFLAAAWNLILAA
jgi:hypothetical protein